MAAATAAPLSTFRVPDGTTLAYRPFEVVDPRGAVLVLHGWAEHLGRWTWVGEQLQRQGYAAFLLDLRGHGRSAGRRGHFVRLAQLLADLHAFRRAVMSQCDAPQIILGHSFGGLLTLRYLQTDPDQPLAGAVVSNPFLRLAFMPPRWKTVLARIAANVWTSLPIPAGIDSKALSRDPAVGQSFDRDPLVHNRMTPGAWMEIRAAQRLVIENANRITAPVLCHLSGSDRIAEASVTRSLLEALQDATLCYYDEMYHECFSDPDRQRVMTETVSWLNERLPT